MLLDLQEKESSDPPEDAADSDGIPDGILPGSIWVNGEDQIVRVEMDLAMFLQELFDEGLTELLNEFDLGGLKLDAEIRSVPARLTFSGFDEYNLLRLPEY